MRARIVIEYGTQRESNPFTRKFNSKIHYYITIRISNISGERDYACIYSRYTCSKFLVVFRTFGRASIMQSPSLWLSHNQLHLNRLWKFHQIIAVWTNDAGARHKTSVLSLFIQLTLVFSAVCEGELTISLVLFIIVARWIYAFNIFDLKPDNLPWLPFDATFLITIISIQT